MAVMHVRSKTKKKYAGLIARLPVVVAAISAVFGVAGNVDLMFFFGFVSVFLWISQYVVLDSAKACGDAGEVRTRTVLAGKLGDDYHVFHSVPLPNPDGRDMEADFVVIGPTGLFVVENKDYSGVPVGSDDGMWEIRKIGRGGTAYSSVTKNPLRQVSRHVQLLKKHVGGAIWINPVISLSRNGNTGNINSRYIPVMTATAVPRFILSRPEGALDAATIRRLIGIVTNLQVVA